MKKLKYNEGVELKIKTTKEFRFLWDAYGLTDQDLARLEQEIRDFENQNEDPTNSLGDTIEGTGGAKKYRFSSSEDPSGKSGGYRIIYCIYRRRIYSLVLLYSKSDKESLTKGEKNELKKLIQDIKKEN